jgi:hypothetical protein
VIGERERGEAELLCAQHERLGKRGAVEEGEGGVGVELGELQLDPLGRLCRPARLTRSRACGALLV